ncbi:toluene 4-monooxygenase protein D [Solimonas aquatica]|uniref:Toluene 4-monooxygenase protein D n=1 Tax=Solimonas aquatica TaxID=489703 RepID=A0A1H9BKA0_9GAMM|nr:MmoB/DmpM family protein [Solimonas aquatica]SEP89167.1 toluene 4-monooxygenase protein D [Solimonas aquatica]
MSDMDKAHLNNMVGPIMRQGALARAVFEAAEVDNPDRKILMEDKVAYVRIQTEDEMILRQETIEEMLGKPFKLNQLEVDMASFAGRIETKADHVRFYFAKHL